ncbi:MAG TPA: aminotransferase class V-fold PLP-dependent enzyme, partial [Anaerolineales bacterium]|nr:aminotransferase class V-fold PLP-dependent enzyme [Anaerolineales bacterium]
SPNVIGAVALAASLKFLSQVGMDTIAAHEADLTRYALEKLTSMSGIKVYGSTDPSKAQDRVGAIPFHVEGVQHGLVAAVLGFEGGIGVRDGCFCAHPYILRLLKITDVEYAQFHERVMHRNRADLPGLLRMSFGCYSNFEDVDRLMNMLERITSGNFKGNYEVHKPSGSYFPKGFDPGSVRKYFTI